MKKKITAVLTGVLAASVILTGCQASKGIETDDLKITQYKDIEIDKVEEVAKVTDEDVETYIQSTLESEGTTTEIKDRAVESGDTVDINFVGKMDGEEFEGGSAENYSLTIGSKVFIDGFEDSIIGHKAGDTFDWKGKFPDDYAAAEMAGKDVVFTITVNAITVEEIPELTDEFVKTVSEKSKTVDEYKAEVKKQLEEDAEEAYKSSIADAAWEAVLENVEIKKYTEGKVEEISENLINQYQEAAKYYEMEYDDFIQGQMNVSVEDFEKQVEDAAKSSVKQTMVTDAIAKAEKIEVDDATYKEQLKVIAEQYGYEDTDELEEAAEEEELKEIALNNLVKEWLGEHCIQVASK